MGDGLSGSEWEISRIESKASPVWNPQEANTNQNMSELKTALVIHINLKRKTQTYYKLLYMPIYGIKLPDFIKYSYLYGKLCEWFIEFFIFSFYVDIFVQLLDKTLIF